MASSIKGDVPGLPGMSRTLSADELSSHSSALTNLRLHEFFTASADFYIKANISLDLQALRAYYASLRQIFEYLCSARNQDRSILDDMSRKFDALWRDIVSLTVKFENKREVNYTEYLEYLSALQMLDAQMILAWQIPLQYFFRSPAANLRRYPDENPAVEKVEEPDEKFINTEPGDESTNEPTTT